MKHICQGCGDEYQCPASSKEDCEIKPGGATPLCRDCFYEQHGPCGY